MRNDNVPLTRLYPLSPEKWWGASGSATGKAYFQGSYGVEITDKGRWIATHNEVTRIPNKDTDFATKEAAMQACVDDRRWCILRAQSRKSQPLTAHSAQQTTA